MHRWARAGGLVRRGLCTKKAADKTTESEKAAEGLLGKLLKDVKPLTDATVKNIDSFSKRAAEQAKTFTAKAQETAAKGAASAAGSTKTQSGEEKEKAQTGPSKSWMEHFKSAVEDVKSELLTDARSTRANPYEAGQARGLRRDGKEKEVEVEVNAEATGIKLHKDSKWYKQWEDFRETNKFVQTLFGMKMKFDESDNLIVRSIRSVTERVEESMQGEDSDLLQVMTAIKRIDPRFDKEEFIVEVEKQIFPGVLESFYKGDLDTLKKWCNEPSFAVLQSVVQQTDYKSRMTKIVDIGKTDMVTAMFMAQQPVLVFSSRVQTVEMERDPKTGEGIIKPDDKVTAAYYILALSKDVERFDSEWEIVELAVQQEDQNFI